MKVNNPITIDGEVFTHVNINLAITYHVNGEDSGDANAAMRLVPARIDQDGTVVTKEDAAIGQAIASLADGDEAVANAGQAIFAAIQSYLAAKGI